MGHGVVSASQKGGPSEAPWEKKESPVLGVGGRGRCGGGQKTRQKVGRLKRALKKKVGEKTLLVHGVVAQTRYKLFQCQTGKKKKKR